MALCSPNKTPTSQAALGSDPEGPPIKEKLEVFISGWNVTLSLDKHKTKILRLQLAK